MSSDFKDTEYGQVPSSWRRVLLKDLCVAGGVQTGPFGSQLHKEDYVQIGTPIVTVEHLGDNHFTHQNLPRVSDDDRTRLAKYTLQKGDIVFSRVGSVDRRALVTESEKGWLFSGRCLRVRPDQSKVNSKWLSYFFGQESFKEHIRSIAVGATMPSLNTKLLEGIRVYAPDISSQEKVADYLWSLDAKIQTLKSQNTALEAIAQRLFRSWFVNFDPVHAKAAGKEPEAMSAELAALFPSEFEDSELGPIPRGWRIGNVGDNFILTMGQSPPGHTYNESGEGLPFYQGRADFGFRVPSVRVFCSAPTRIALPGDTLVSVRAPVGDVNMALEKCCVGRGVAAVRHPEGNRSFVFYAMKQLGRHFEKFDGEGTVFGSINKKDFQALPLVLPPTGLLSEYERIVGSFDGLVLENIRVINLLSNLRDHLLPRLISGKLSLEEAQQVVEEATAV